MCGTEGPYSGERIPEIDFEPFDKLIQWSSDEGTIKRLLGQELNELAERRGKTVEVNEEVKKKLEAEAPQTTSDEARRYEEENGDGNDELE